MDAIEYLDYQDCKEDYRAQVEAVFRKLLSDGLPHYLHEASGMLDPYCDLDRRCLGCIPQRMELMGEIALAGFENSPTAPRRLWVATDPASIYRLGRAAQ